MTQLGFQIQPNSNAADNLANANVGSTIAANARPSIVTLESGVQAIIKITGFAYIDGIPVAVAGALAEDVNASVFLERSSDRTKLKLKA